MYLFAKLKIQYKLSLNFANVRWKKFIGNRLCFVYKTQNIYRFFVKTDSVNILYSIKNMSVFNIYFPNAFWVENFAERLRKSLLKHGES